jgi:phosphopantothenoylcysteine decarboxylase / phosphopantothenate---cysteine ligase
MRVVVTAGGTREAIDPVRYLSNRSSGKMGFALARAAAGRGASVTLITTQRPAPIPGDVTVVEVESAAQMRSAVLDAVEPGCVLLMCAAVADYTPADASARKIKKTGETLTLELVRTRDILHDVAALESRQDMFLVGFAAETDDPVANAVKKLTSKNLDLVVLNDVSKPGIGMGSDYNAVTVIDAAGVVAHVERSPKDEVAAAVVDVVWQRWVEP